MTVAIYTAVYGGYDPLRPHPVIPGVDFHCFTDDRALLARRDWIVHLEPSSLPPRLAAKRPKILAPQIAPLDAHDVTLWVDASCEFTSATFVEDALSDLGPDGFALHRNPDLDCIYAQAISCMRGLPPDAAPALLRRAARYYAEGHPEHWGLWACGAMARRRSARLDAAMQDWWRAVTSWIPGGDPIPFGLPRDQIDLPPVLREHGIRPLEWPHDQPRNPWWRHRPHGSSEDLPPDLRREIEGSAGEGGGWCSRDKATQLAAVVLEIEPATVVELGVWTGGTAIPMAIALRHLGAGVLTAVDAWSPTASAEGQEGEHAAWWRRVGADGHENARSIFLARLDKHGIPREQCVVLHGRSDDAPVPDVIDILHIDANHGPQAAADAGRWARAVRIGGVLIINDLEWPGGHMLRARDRAIELGFVETRRIEGGCMMRRTSQKTNQQTEGP